MKLKNIFYLLCTSIIFGCVSKSGHTLLFVGSFTDGKPDAGIHVYAINTDTGETTLLHEEKNTINPSYLKIGNHGHFLYSVLESQLPTHGKVAAISVDSLSGKLKLLNMQDSGGRNPAHLSLHPSGRYLVNSNYTDAGISVFNINSDGSLGPHHQLLEFKDSSVVKGRQDAAHLHSTNFSPDGQFLFGQDLGADKIRAFKVIDTDAGPLRLRPSKEISVKPGSGPRHFTFHPNGTFGYGISELSGKVTAYQYSDGDLVFLEDYPSYATNQEIYRAADIHISPDGKFLYTSNRGPKEDSIGIFSIDQNSGKLTLVGHEPTYGKHPRNFCLDPSGQYLLVANQFSDNIVLFKRDRETGLLTKLSEEIQMDNPSSLQMYKYRVE
ncbi:6-phosphogluconolactonase [Croceitalea dokdonensis DOKDO 023]|uniref:6-phosphogluconolactonase n=1 Tax=Croceitalea dokdonensis DOKDO 023 TaxID=1300341 RepID=A0A0P7A267_9FLAO|nr:lactonase family protein [Croceitalea dokdonensis]KPM30537.1 6-phosphogluconolactonase [Croceitalea dokdonensis DOKDO 023]